ncbi:Suf-domain-containing protein [Phellopilus nigrolimitatus]|nr:Suf-domain-containing protein [Phellopilus nigrolimitatus]
MNAEIQSEDVKVKPEPTEASLQPPPSEWALLRKRVEDNSYSEAAWNALLDNAEDSSDLEKIKEAYEALLEKYPNTSSAQISYLNHFLTNQATFPFAEALFARFLRTSASVDLWKFYIIYVRRRLNVGPTTRDTVAKAYEFALQHVGQDKDSSDIWAEYIQFVKSGEASSTWEEQQKMDTLRKIYQRAVQIPLENVEMLWKDYEAFENSLNKITAKKFLQDLSPAHMQARSKLRDLRQHLGPLLPPAHPTNGARAALNLPHKPTYVQNDRSLAGAWKLYLRWEESNPLEIEDKVALTTRLQGVYRKAVVRMRFFSEIWFMAYTWASGAGRADEALALLKAGIEANPTSFLLNFALAESFEIAKNYVEVHATFNRLLQSMHEDLEDLKVKSDDEAAQSSTSDSVPGSAGTADASAENGDVQNGGGLSKEASFATTKTTSSSSSSPSEVPPHTENLRERQQEYGLVYIMYIRFALRAEGVDASRAVFGKARKDKWTTWEVFESAALMEYHVAKQLGVANKIFGLAHARFPNEVDFVVRYLTFLMSVNDENNARALFENAAATFDPEKARALWERWARYEYQYGNLEAALKLEKRMAEAFPKDPPIKRFAQKHSYANIDGIANRDLGVSQARKEKAAREKAAAGLQRQDTIPAINGGAPPSSASQSQVYGSGTTNFGGPGGGSFRRPQSVEREPRERERRRDETKAGMPPLKRSRDFSPPPRDRERERERWGGGGGNRRYGSPASWPDRGERVDRGDKGDRGDRERNRERERSPPRRNAVEREEPPRPVIPQVLNWFVGTLPPPETFDGPVFRTDDLMQVFRNAVIPGSGATRSRSPSIAVRPTRPPPDYGPYRGPGGRGGRY